MNRGGIVKAAILVLPIAAMFALASCATSTSTPKFVPARGTAEVYTGKGGSMTKVDGMDVWENGNPPRKIQLIGYISESVKTATPVSQIVAEARKQGGDAIVQIKGARGVLSWAVYKYVK
jgi:hypothetical protein